MSRQAQAIGRPRRVSRALLAQLDGERRGRPKRGHWRASIDNRSAWCVLASRRPRAVCQTSAQVTPAGLLGQAAGSRWDLSDATVARGSNKESRRAFWRHLLGS